MGTSAQVYPNAYVAVHTEHVFSASDIHPRSLQPGGTQQTFIMTLLHTCGLQTSIQGKNQMQKSLKVGDLALLTLLFSSELWNSQ